MSRLRSQVLRLAASLPQGDPTRRQILEVVRQAGFDREALFGAQAVVRSLPPGVQKALKLVGYGSRDVSVDEATSVQSSSGGEGRRAFLLIVDIMTGRVVQEATGSWGGMNPYETNELDLRKDYPLSPGLAAIKGTEGGRVWALVFHHPADKALFTPASSSADITPEEKKAIGVLGLVSSYRQNEWNRLDLPGRYSANHPLIQNLIAKGLAAVNARGAVSLTTAGKNVK